MSQRKQKSQVKNLQNQKSNTFEFGVFNLAIPEHIEEPQDLSKVRTKFIPFGTNNLFPQYLAELKRKSSTHRSVLAQKYMYIWMCLFFNIGWPIFPTPCLGGS